MTSRGFWYGGLLPCIAAASAKAFILDLSRWSIPEETGTGSVLASTTCSSKVVCPADSSSTSPLGCCTVDQEDSSKGGEDEGSGNLLEPRSAAAMQETEDCEKSSRLSRREGIELLELLGCSSELSRRGPVTGDDEEGSGSLPGSAVCPSTST
jgi:hypothetical protein